MNMILRNSLIVLSLILGLILCVRNGKVHHDDAYFYNRAVKVLGERGTCSGEQVVAPSGTTYILSAGHCMGLADRRGEVRVELEEGLTILRKVVAEDPTSDLMLIEGVPNLDGLKIAEYILPRDHVRTFTRGKGFKTYRTEGVIIEEQSAKVAHSMIVSPEDLAACLSMPKYKVESGLCVMETQANISTALVVPGSSGGMVVNDAGELVGVVSATDGIFGCFVITRDIKKFLSKY